MAVVRSGQVLERNDFYPYGGRHANASLGMDTSNRWRFSGKELQTTAGVNLLDFGARFYDDRLCRWTTRDPMSEKYYGFSPYNYCAGDPVNLVDHKGDSLAILNAGGLIGHSAMLIQHADGKWGYYSYNGDKIYVSTGGKRGGKNYHDLGEMTFDSPQSFLNGPYNIEGNSTQIENNSINNYVFGEAYIIPTTNDKDQKAIETFKSEGLKDYSLISHHCAHVVQKALQSAGAITSRVGVNPFFPQQLYDNVKINNKGQEINLK